MNVEKVAYQVLKHLGVPCSIGGYKALKAGIVHLWDNPDDIESVTRKLYPAVADMVGSTRSRVERNMRHAIEFVYSNTDPDIIQEYFGNTVSYTKGKLTNSQFLAGIMEHIRMEYPMEMDLK